MFGWGKKDADHPSSVENLGGKLLDAVDFCVLDCEMTGLDPQQHQIIALGAVRISGGCVAMNRRFYRLIKPQNLEMSRENVLIHGISHQALEKGHPAEEVYRAFREFCGDAVLVGHCVGLDMAFLAAIETRLGLPGFEQPVLDTMKLGRWHLQYLDRNRPVQEGNLLQLSQLCARYGVPQFQQHHAFFDAVTTACLFRKQWELLHGAGYYTFADLHRLSRQTH